MNTENKKLVIFDFDGVLVDTLGIVYKINKEINLDLSLEEYRSFFEGNINFAVRKDGSPKKFHSGFFDLYDSGSREVIIPDVLKLIVKELARDYILIIISSTHTESIKKILERESVLEYFSEILGVDVEKNKIIKINSVLKKYKILPKDTVFITDTLGDIREASKCEVESIAVTWGYHEKETLVKGTPVAIIDNPILLEETINNVLK